MRDNDQRAPVFIIQREKDSTFFIEEEGGAYVWGKKKHALRFDRAEMNRWLSTLQFHFGPCRIHEVIDDA